MNVEELKALALAAEPLLAAAEGLDGQERAVTYNDLVSRFLERVGSARNRLAHGQVVEPTLEQELRLLAEALPGMRRRAESAARWERLDPDE